jgi:hypothetical protein
MNIKNRSKKGVALLVVIAFVSFAMFNGLPLGAAGRPAGTTVRSTAGDSAPQALEKAGARPPQKKVKILPLALVAAGFVGVIVLAILLGKKDSAAEKDLLHEEFDQAADANWKQRQAANWSVGGGFYRCSAVLGALAKNYWEWSVYDHAWSKADYTVEARMKVSLLRSGYGLMLSDGADMNLANVYQFLFLGDGRYKVRKIVGYDLYRAHNNGPITDFRDWTLGGAKAVDWNTFTVAKNSSTYVLSVNGNALATFTDAAYDPRYVSIIVYTQYAQVQLEVDSIHIDIMQ